MVKMAIMGAGTIAVKMALTIKEVSDVEAYAIAARNLERAEKFAEEYGFTRAYGSYEEMLGDEEVDLVYVAVPHTLHYECAKMCLEAGKNVLCEKPFCVNIEQTKELIQIAEDRQLLITEAIWTRYMPSRKMIDDILSSGRIGEITSLTANLGYELSQVKRIWDPKLAGGALMDVGIYLIHFARMIFGEREAQITSTALFKDGVDMIDSIIMTFENGKVATMQSNVNAVQSRNATIFGTKGYLEIVNVNNPEEIKIYDDQYKKVESIKVPEQITGFEYEVEACVRALENHEIQCGEIPHAETIKVMEIMDEIRNSWGYDFPGEV